jgi:hypothetical protein
MRAALLLPKLSMLRMIETRCDATRAATVPAKASSPMNVAQYFARSQTSRPAARGQRKQRRATSRQSGTTLIPTVTERLTAELQVGAEASLRSNPVVSHARFQRRVGSRSKKMHAAQNPTQRVHATSCSLRNVK